MSSSSPTASPRACPLCSEVSHRLALSIAPYVLSPPAYVQCQRCGLVFHEDALPEPSFEPVSFESFLSQTKWKLPIYRERLNWLMRRARVPQGRAVDIGTKDGAAVKVLVERGWQAIGYDPDDRYHAFAKKSYGVEIRPEWFTAEAVGPGTLALVTAYHVFEHIPDPLPWLSEVWNALQPQGILNIQTPNLRRIHATQICITHVALYTAETLRKVLESSGFKVLAMSEHAPWAGAGTYDQLSVVAQRDRHTAVQFSLGELDRGAAGVLQRPILEFPRSRVLPIRVYRAVKRRMHNALGRAAYHALS